MSVKILFKIFDKNFQNFFGGSRSVRKKYDRRKVPPVPNPLGHWKVNKKIDIQSWIKTFSFYVFHNKPNPVVGG